MGDSNPYRSKPLGVISSTIGTLCFISAMALLIIALIAFSFAENGLGWGFAAGGGGLVLFGLSHLLIGYGRRLRASTAQETLKNDPRPPVLYCRAFSDDEGFGGINLNMEEELARAFKAVGPVIAIGKPGEKLRTAGASRKYISDDDWETEVKNLMGISQLIIFYASASKGLLWEYQTALSLVSPNKIVIVPPKEKDDWIQFRQDSNDINLPENIQDADLICLDTQGSPRLVWRMNKQKEWWEDSKLIQRLLFKASI